MQRHFVSIGGWCGPALILGKLGLRHQSYPFDFSRVTMDGVIHFLQHGFRNGFFPPGSKPYRPECVGIWVLFRGLHTAFAHFDLNDPKVEVAFQRKIERWDSLLRGVEPVTFFRTVTATNPQDELSLVPLFEDCVRRLHPQLDFRTVLVVHDQGFLWEQRRCDDCTATTPTTFSTSSDDISSSSSCPVAPEIGFLSSTLSSLNHKNSNNTTYPCYPCPPAIEMQRISKQCKLWCLQYTEDGSKSLFDRCENGYAHIVADAMNDALWKNEGGDDNKNSSRDHPSSTRIVGLPQWSCPPALTPTSSSIATCYVLSRRGDVAGTGGSSNSSLTTPQTVGNVSSSLPDTNKVVIVPTSSLTVALFPWRRHNNLALIDGTASVGGTCIGVGSTRCSLDGACSFCSKRDFHKAGKPFRSERPFNSEEDDLLLVHLYRLLSGVGDKVEAVEQLAHEMNRGAFEVICRLQFLTNSSTKITEGFDEE